MKTISRICLILAIVALTAAPALAGGAITQTWHEDTYGTGEGWFDCLGPEHGDLTEFVDLEFHWVGVWHITETPSGAYNWVYNEHTTSTGIGRDTGDSYEAHFTWHQHGTGRVGEVEQYHWPMIMRNITTGRTEIQNWNVHFTYNANGELVVERWPGWPPDGTCLH